MEKLGAFKVEELLSPIAPLRVICNTLESFAIGSSPSRDPKTISQKIQPKTDKMREANNDGQNMRQKETLTVDIDTKL